MLWNWSHLPDGIDNGRGLGIAGRIEEIKWTTTEVAIELCVERRHKARTVLGQLGRCYCDGLQWLQLIHWAYAREARFCEQYSGGSIEWNDLQEYKGHSTNDDLWRNCGISCRRVGSKFYHLPNIFSKLTDFLGYEKGSLLNTSSSPFPTTRIPKKPKVLNQHHCSRAPFLY